MFEEDELVHYTSQRLIKISEHIIEEKEQLIWIIDLNGKIMQLASKKILDLLHKIILTLQRYFPDILHRWAFHYIDLFLSTLPCCLILFGQRLRLILPNRHWTKWSWLEMSNLTFTSMLNHPFFLNFWEEMYHSKAFYLKNHRKSMEAMNNRNPVNSKSIFHP